ncbi:hypothetical protein MDMS009_822 [Methylophaga thiooxydans DMS010]|uniref:Uncharacterized protein n=1 Tax=Methylophaga thiooxydans DMS010 TaxID=637616 RepID=C0N3Y6_9GAMM|nr:hypothetical protein MDMS009_822 [Methylophaga thiooxydans DMS010]
MGVAAVTDDGLSSKFSMMKLMQKAIIKEKKECGRFSEIQHYNHT